MSGDLLFEGKDWSFETLQNIHDAVEVVAKKELGLETYPNQIEVITAEQMLDAYSSTGMPLCTATGPSASVSPQTRNLSRRPSGTGLRNRHQRRSLHQLCHGGKQRHDAGAGDRPRRLWP